MLREYFTMYPGLLVAAAFVVIAIVLVIATSLQAQWRAFSTIERNIKVAGAGLADLDGAIKEWCAGHAADFVPLVDSDSGDVEEMGEAEAIAFMAVEEPRPDPTLSWVDVYMRPTFRSNYMPCVIAESRKTGEVVSRWDTRYRDDGYGEMLSMRKRHKLEMG